MKRYFELEFFAAESTPRRVVALNVDLDGQYFGLTQSGHLFGSRFEFDEDDVSSPRFVNYFDGRGALVTKPLIFLGTNISNLFVAPVRQIYLKLDF